jgi:hypothetical protein
VPGYPIRTPSDQSSVDSSPRTIAASHVLHRLLMPRHPPCALNNLTNTHIKKSRHKCAQKQKMLASTVQFSTTTRTATTPPTREAGERSPQRTQHPPTPKSGRAVVLSGPNSVPPTPRRCRSLVFPLFSSNPLPPPRRTQGGTEALHHQPRAHRTFAGGHPDRWCSVKLLRKEVIQPHLPVRLPCYDFVPIASPTFDRSPPCGLGHGLRVLPTFVT